MSENTITLNSLVRHAWKTVQNPQDGIQALMDMEFDRSFLWQGLAAVVICSVILMQIEALTMGLPGIPVGFEIILTPWSAALMQVSGFVLMVFAVFWIGRAVGGEARFEWAILSVAWLQFIMLCLQVIQTLTVQIMPPVALLLAVFGVGLFFYLLSHFILVIHGFDSVGKVFLMIILSIFGIMFGLATLLTLIGVSAPVPV